MRKQLVLGAFEEFTPSFISNGWPHERSDPAEFATLAYWQRLSRELDAAGFDFLFFADALGYPMHDDVIPEVVVREAVQFPVLDPLTIVSGLAATVDKATRVFTDPAAVHRIRHHGEFFDVDGYFPVSPSPQRTPTLFQAGASARGVEFASRIAECVFIQERNPEKAAALVERIRDEVERRGRPRDSVKIINSISVVVAESKDAADRLRASLTAAPSRDAMAALFLGWSGVNLLGLDPTTPIDELSTEVGQTTLAMYQNAGLTVGDVLDRLAQTLGGTKITGTAEDAAAELEELADSTDVDGFLIEHTFGGLASYREFIDEVMPILRARGVIPDRPRSGSLREMLTGTPTARLEPTHPGAAFRRGRAKAAEGDG